MTRKLVKTGNSTALIVDKTMKEHLDVTDEVEVSYEKGRIVLRKPMTIEEAAERTIERYGNALKNLAK
jgi:antitoxin component of MazEF toxin-antitoxin module